MTTPFAAESRQERYVRPVAKTDTGTGLVETPLRAGNWIGFLGSWVLLAAAATSLFIGSMRLLGVGGFCASGGPYEIVQHCDSDSGLSITFGMFGSAVALLFGIFAARGFGPPVHGFFWSLLFGLEGVAFLLSAFVAQEVVSGVWLFCGLLFLALASPPLFLIRMGWPRSIFGRRRLDGRSLIKHGLPVRDARVLAAAWTTAVAAGVILALIATTLPS